MTNELEEIKERAETLFEEGYKESLSRPDGLASMEHVAPKLGLDPWNWEDKKEFRTLANYLSGKGFIESYADGFGLFRITPEGRARVEGETPQPVHVTNHTYNLGGDAYSSVFGAQQNVEMNVSFDMRTAEIELNQTRKEVERRGGPDAEELQDLLNEVEDLLRSGQPLEKGRLSKYLGVLQRNGWIAGPVASTLMNFAMRAATS
jgi:hypothetical protein